MNRDSIVTYIHDHLAGAAVAIQIMKQLEQSDSNEDLRVFAHELRVKVETDKKVLEDILAELGASKSSAKQVTAWMAGRLSQVKLKRRFAGPLGVFEALEALSLGILGKRALWRMLKEAKIGAVPALKINLDLLIAEAERQFAEVEAWRLAIGKEALQ